MQPTIDHVGLSICQFIDAWRVLCSSFPSYSSHRVDGVACVFSGVPIGFFNAAVLTARGVFDGEVTAKAESRSRVGVRWRGALAISRNHRIATAGYRLHRRT